MEVKQMNVLKRVSSCWEKILEWMFSNEEIKAKMKEEMDKLSHDDLLQETISSRFGSLKSQVGSELILERNEKANEGNLFPLENLAV